MMQASLHMPEPMRRWFVGSANESPQQTFGRLCAGRRRRERRGILIRGLSWNEATAWTDGRSNLSRVHFLLVRVERRFIPYILYRYRIHTLCPARFLWQKLPNLVPVALKCVYTRLWTCFGRGFDAAQKSCLHSSWSSSVQSGADNVVLL